MAEQQRSFDEKYEALEKVFPKDKEIITSHEAKIMASCLYAITIGQALSQGISFIEQMLYDQLTAAVGKVLLFIFINFLYSLLLFFLFSFF